MEILETKLVKLVASEGKLLVNKEKKYDEEGNELPKDGSKIIYLAKNSNPDDYIEIDEANEEEQKSVWA